ncbi:tRNA (adenosine(37)-N6)-threonylcarbamoyltransferase complex dimerization subunit type 1 TsaB [Prosthecochloris sp.]|uniref:tRNA (adenosine(37)-N6)-threonylcarbamoyltransferase complex dimerization subunit type 1 TsaB n=1 Tax=Prosthecochloris sp. TaxID=290513 RepID=UPI00257D8259|nr:tRNA (adenosine(37)-N6)-threonylcarbamoyltransferase complex dimerization subunit type 1 TsaB [Prosthecochloris sp.]
MKCFLSFLTFDFFLLTFSFSHRILAIECTHQCVSVAVGGPEGIVEETVWEWQRTAESIIPLVDKVLASAEIAVSDIDLLALSSGPGSFTSLRIGMATAKGLAYGTAAPLVTVSTMEALAKSARDRVDSPFLVPAIPARKGEFYYALYASKDDGLEEIEKTTYAPVDRMKDFLELRKGRCAVVVRDISPLQQVCRAASVGAVKADFFTAASLIPLANKKYTAGEISSLETVIPDYQQKFRPKKQGRK